MHGRSFVFLIVLLILSVGLDQTHAQDATLKVLNSGIKHGPKTITVEFIATNDTKSRIYLRNTSFANTEEASLGSGEQLRYPRVIGIEDCRHDLSNCLGQSGTDLNEYSQIEPGKFITFSITYQTQNIVSDNDTISLNVSLIVRYTSNNEPSQAGTPTLAKFTFNNKHLSQQ